MNDKMFRILLSITIFVACHIVSFLLNALLKTLLLYFILIPCMCKILNNGEILNYILKYGFFKVMLVVMLFELLSIKVGPLKVEYK